MKLIRHDDPNEMKLQAETELLVLQKTCKWKQTIDLVDNFTDDDGNRYYITNLPKLTLADFTAKIIKQHDIRTKDIAILILKIASALRRLASQKIIHRDICMENIVMRIKKPA